MDISLRPVSASDLQKIYEWRNDPSVRKNSFSTEEIPLPDHMAYWKERLAASRKLSFIIESGNTPSGLLRLDPYENGYEVHILIAPAHQGKGIGLSAIAAAKKEAKKLGIEKLIAHVKPGNLQSQAIFSKNGFSGGPEHFECSL